MIFVLPTIIKAVLEVGIAKLRSDPNEFNQFFASIYSSVPRFAEEAASLGIVVNNFIEPAAELNTWITTKNIKIALGKPRLHEQVEQITISYGTDRDTDPALGGGAQGIVRHDMTTDAYKQYLKNIQVESRSPAIHIVSVNADIVGYMVEFVKYVLRIHRHVFESLGIKAFELAGQEVDYTPYAIETGFHLYHSVIVFSCKTASSYERPYDFYNANTIPENRGITSEPKEIDENQFVKLGEDSV